MTYDVGNPALFEQGLSLDNFSRENRIRAEVAFESIEEWSPADWACAVAGEVGEACNLIKKLRRGEPVQVELIGKEIADAITYLDLLAAKLGLNFADIVINKWNEISERHQYPIRLRNR